jgi:iron complex transport system ATP-binding protein
VTELVSTDLTVRRQGRLILDGVSLKARSGEFTAIIGANGAGKSTLLSILAGLSRPDTGLISIDGKSLHLFTRNQLARIRAYLPQNPRCEWPIAVERLVALGLTPILPAFGELPDALERRIEAALLQFDLLPRRLQPATTLSGGELSRAMLARAVVGNPDVLIVDEPTTGLDPRHALDAAHRLRALAKEGKLVIASLHDLTLVARYTTRVIALVGGRIAAQGPTGEILTSELLRKLFDVDASLTHTLGGLLVDYLPSRTVDSPQNL